MPSEGGGSGGFLASARIVSLCTLLSRVLGLVRDTLTSRVFGASLVMDTFGIAYLVPNLFRRLFGEGALTAAFVPAFIARAEAGRREEAFALLNRLFTRLSLFLGAVALLGMAATYGVDALWPDPKTQETTALTRIMLPYVVFICGAALLGGALNSLRHFFTPAFAPVLLNVVWIAAIVALRDIRWMAWAVVAGGLLQLLVMIPPLLSKGARLRPDLSMDDGVREVGVRFAPVVLGLALVQINELIGRIIAEVCVPGDGAVSTLYYGNQIVQLPLALIGAPLATAIFPSLSGAAAGGRTEEFRELFQKGMRAALYFSLPAAVGGVVLATPIIRLLYEGGRFGPADTARTAQVFALMVVSLWCTCANQVQIRAFYAHGDTRTPVRVSMAMIVLSLGLNLALVWPLAERGIALAASLSAVLNFLVMNAILRRRFPSLALGPVWRTGLLSLPACAAMGAAAWGLHALLSGLFPGPTLVHKALATLLPVGAGGLVYLAVTWAMGMAEPRSLLKRRA